MQESFAKMGAGREDGRLIGSDPKTPQVQYTTDDDLRDLDE